MIFSGYFEVLPKSKSIIEIPPYPLKKIIFKSVNGSLIN
nr:MAG TPA: hypothetical protein [Caudoviricetes sp.]